MPRRPRIGFRGDSLQRSRDWTSRYWRVQAGRYVRNLGRFAAFGPGAIAAAAAANFFQPRTYLDTRPPITMPRDVGRPAKRQRVVSHNPNAKSVQDASGYVQMQKASRKRLGRRIRFQTKINKMVAAQMLTRIDRFQSLVGSAAANGSYYLSYCKNTADTAKHLPFYCFDLTSLQKNVGSTAPLIEQAYPMMRLRRLNDDSYGWTIQSGFTPTGTANSFWQVERAPYANDVNNVPYEKAFLEWADIRLSAWGATEKPSTFEMLIVRFYDDQRSPPSRITRDGGTTQIDIHPSPVKPAAADIAGNVEYSEHQKFWEAQMDNLIGSPQLVRGQGEDQRGMSVLYRKVINLNPTATFETDARGHIYHMKYFYNMNMLCDYKRANVAADDDPTVPYAQMDNNNYFPVELGASSCGTVLRNRKSRLFLVIRGFTTTLGTAVNPDAPTSLEHADLRKVCASFDLCVRRKISVI